MSDLIKYIINKLFSAQFIMALMLTGTLCYGFVTGKVSGEAFLPIAVLAIDWYFKRKRNGEGNV